MILVPEKFYTMTVGEIAATIPGATTVFRRFNLDFCCGGRQVLKEALLNKNINQHDVISALNELKVKNEEPKFSIPRTAIDYTNLTNFIVRRYHQIHRLQFPELITLSERVERVHGNHHLCPAGLTTHLEVMYSDFFSHMDKEEKVLFPMLCRGERDKAMHAIVAMQIEHNDHGRALEDISRITHNYTLPETACNTWRALYEGIFVLREDLMHHIHLENNILFAG